VKKRLIIPFVCVVGLTAGAALAEESWSSFDAAFPGLPCKDGWAACVVDDVVVSPGMVLDQGSRPHPAHMRLGFFDLDPLPGLSPFGDLSAYEQNDVAAAEPAPRAQPRASSRPAATKVRAKSRPTGASARATTRTARSTPSSTSSSPPVGTASRASREPTDRSSRGAGSSRTIGMPSTQPTNPPRDDPSSGTSSMPPLGLVPAGSPPRASTEPAATTSAPEPAGLATRSTPPPTAATEPASEPVASIAPAPVAPMPAAASDTCDDLISLEGPAMLGELSVGQRKCLEGRLAGGAAQTQKNKISRVLIADAEGRRDQADWERLMKRHLEDIDRSDPNLCFKYSIHLSRGGAARAHGVIRWADYALENKSSWKGASYTRNVYGLYKLRGQAANRLWQSAEKKFVADRSDVNKGKAERYRDMTKNYSREWLDYAKASSQDTKAPLALCVSASGNREFCEG